MLLSLPCISYTSEWFVARRGLANGVIYAGTSLGGLLLPLLLPSLIEKRGTAIALRITTIAFAVFLLPALPFLKGRLPESKVHGPSTRSAPEPKWFKEPSFLFIVVVNTLQGFGGLTGAFLIQPYLFCRIFCCSALVTEYVLIHRRSTSTDPRVAFASELKLSATNASLPLAVLNG